LKRHEDGAVEIAYFGLLQEFIGRGLGKYLLTEAVREAWRTGARRVWLHTCTLDGEAALPNYKARGFKPFKEEVFEVDLG
jgi:GNAT superfamily N-acetyltransferase